MAVTIDNTNKPLIPRGDDISPKGYNRAALYSGKALDFDGVNDWVDLAGLRLSGNNQSFAFYLKADAWNNFDYIFDIFSNRFIIASKPANNLSIYDGTSWQSFGEIDDTINTNFFVVTIEGTTSKAYLNGVQFGSNLTITLRDFSAANECALMSQYDGAQQFFPGQLSGFKIFNTALTAAQVADLYNNPEKIVPTGVDNTALKLWLTMQEGAGTTAYDGSGNGNHGTISGATYTHGIGAPVSQTAVIDWNKLYVFDKTDDYASTTSYTDVTGTKTYKVSFEVFDTSTDEQQIFQFFNVSAGKGVVATYNTFGTYKRLGFRGYASGADFGASSWNDVEHNTPYELVFTINWDTETLESISLSGDAPVGTSTARMNPVFTGLVVGYRWNAYPFGGIINYFEVVGEEKWTNASGFKSESGSYDMTIGGSPTQILAPQGLTSGRDITGVNLFENVRKQGALNLDGNSWAEVHDNESLDFGTGSFSLEAWVKVENINTGAGINAIFGLGGNATAGNTAYIETNAFLNSVFRYDSGFSVGPVLTRGDWAHIVGTFDGTNTKIYSNGVLEDTSSATAVNITNSEVKLIGRDKAGTRYYKDQIAQPRIYNRALTAEEVQRNFDAGKNIYTN